jgi:nucleoside-diphosphate-sugar epimerase
MKVLITGAGGFIGSHLVDQQLAKGNQVISLDLHLDRLSHTKTHPCLTLVEGDVTNIKTLEQVLEGIDVVYHLASAHLDVSLPPSYYEEVNVTASKNLVKLAHKLGVKKYVHCSSVGVIGDVENPPANEETECHPTNIYEQTKLAGEREVLIYSKEQNYPLVVSRLAWVYGPRCPRTAKLFRTIKKGRFILFGSGSNLRHPIFISDAVKGLELCSQLETANSRVFILAGEKPVTVKTLAEEIAIVMGKKPKFIKLPLSVGIMAGTISQILFKLIKKNPPISRRSMDFYIKYNAYDISRAEQQLGFFPKTDLQNGLNLTYQYYREKQNQVKEYIYG